MRVRAGKERKEEGNRLREQEGRQKNDKERKYDNAYDCWWITVTYGCLTPLPHTDHEVYTLI